jgi:beta-1,4-mannosyltransferase
MTVTPPRVDTRLIRVASVPSRHVYVRHLVHPDEVSDGVRVERLEDPPPDRRTPTGAPWWPPPMLEPSWVEATHREFDVFHVQFGFDARSPEELAGLVRTLRRHDKPLVYTVHDLRNPHHLDRSDHDAQLDVLIPAADALVTLTEGAADEVERRWDRRPLVLPHPHVVDTTTMDRLHAAGRRPGPFRFGLHLKSLRASMAPHDVLPVLARAVGDLPDAVLQVNVHRDVVEAGGEHHEPALVALLRDLDGTVDVRVHDYFDDDGLFDHLASLDVSVLPYRFGTHSGWLEACRDLGTAVIVPSCGYYAEQSPAHVYRLDEAAFHGESLASAVHAAHRQGPIAPVAVSTRLEQRRMVAAAHHRLYRDLL